MRQRLPVGLPAVIVVTFLAGPLLVAGQEATPAAEPSPVAGALPAGHAWQVAMSK